MYICLRSSKCIQKKFLGFTVILNISFIKYFFKKSLDDISWYKNVDFGRNRKENRESDVKHHS